MAIELYKLIPDAFTILSEASQKIGQLGVAVVDQENSPRQQQTINSLIAATRIYRTIMRHVVLNDSGTAIAGIQHIEVEIINDLLENLKKTVNVLPIPVYPLPLTTVQFNFGTPGGGLNLGPGQAGDLIVHNGTTWVRLSKGPTGYSLTSTPGGVQWQALVGNGIPSGGSTNQYLRKASNTDYDAVWGSIALAHVTDVTASAAEVNVLDGVNTGSIGASQINQLAGISTSQTIQQQLNAKMSNALASGQFWVGNSSNIAEARTPSGDVTFNNEGVFSYTPLSIEDADINTTAAIQRNKLAGGSSWRLVINNNSGVMDEAAAITANRALVSNSNGIPVASVVTATELGYSSGLTSNIQAQLNTKLSVSLTSVAIGDILTYNGSSWVNLGIGSNGQVLTSNGSAVFWGNATATGLPAGGTANQVLRKIDATDYNAEWHTLVVADMSDLSVTADELNVLSGVNTSLTATQINYLVGVNNPIQSQLDSKLTKHLAFNNIWVGNASNEAVQYGPGNEGEVLMIAGGSPQWQPFPITGDGVVGPGVSTDNAIVRWNGTQGISIQNSGVIIDDSDNISGITSLTLKAAAGIRTGTTNGDTVLLQAYDVDGGSYTTFATLTAANIPTFDLAASTTIDSAYIYRQGGTDVSLADGGTGTSLSDPGEYMLMFWNQSIGQVDWLAIGTNLSLSGSSPVFALNASGGGGGSGHVIENSGTPLDTRDNLNFTGGLTAFDSNPDTVVRLGGTLTTNVVLDGDSSFDFTVTGSPDITLTADTSLQVGLSTNHIAIDSTGIQLAFGSGSKGDMFYEDASGYLTRIGIGTEGQLLTVDASGIPVWDDAPASSVYTDSDAQDAVGNIFVDSTTIDFTYNSGTPSITGIVINNSIDNMKLRQSAGVSVVGRSANSTGNVADITASANGQVLMRASNALSFGLITGANFASASAGTFFAGPISGPASTATFRALSPLDLPFPIRTEPATSYTIQLSDHGHTIYFTSVTGCTVTLPTGLPANFWFTAVRAEGAGTITFVASGFSDINTINNEVTIDFPNGAVSWEYLGDENDFDWYGFGALGSVTGGGGSGTVTSVNNSSITGFATATGGPITGSGTLGYTLDSQSANTVFAGPASGSASTPAFRLLTMTDIPRPAKEIPDATYTVLDEDLGHNLYFTNPTGCVVTLDDSITVSNFWFLAIKDKAMTAGTVQFTNGGSSAILNTVDGETDIIANNGAVSWEYKGSGDWYGWGTLGGGGGGSGGSAHVIKNAGVPLPNQPNLNFRNGLAAIDLNPDSTVGLGGSLVADTTINANSHDFKITAIDAFLIQRSGNNRIEMDASGAIYLHTGGGTASSIILHPTNGITVTAKGSGFGTGTMVVVDSTNSLTNFGPANSTLIGKSGAGAFLSVSVSNGLTYDSSGGSLKLGGALTGNTDITGDFNLNLGTSGSKLNRFVVRSEELTDLVSDTLAGISISSSEAYINFNATGGPGSTPQSMWHAYGFTFTGNATQALFHDKRSTPAGIQYNGDYSANYTNRSLADWGSVRGPKTYTGAQTLSAGSTTTGSAPLYFQNGSLLTTPANGAMEFDGSHLYITIGSTRYQLDQQGGGGGSGTVTSVAATAPAAGLTISGSPITTSGTLTFALANDLAGLENLSGTGLAVRTGTNTWTTRTIVQGTGISVTSGNGVSANPTISLNHLGIQNLSNPGADRLIFWDQSGSKAEWLQVGTGLAISGTTLSVTQILDSGTYTPTFISGSSVNVDSVTFHQAQYLRVGNVVTMSGQVTIDATAAGPVLVHFSPPVASESTFNTASGVVSKWVGGIVGSVSGVPDPPVHALAIQFDSPDGTSQFYMYTCTYEVI